MALTTFETWRRNRVVLHESIPIPGPTPPTYNQRWRRIVLTGLLAGAVGGAGLAYWMWPKGEGKKKEEPKPALTKAPDRPAPPPEPIKSSRAEFKTEQEAIDARVEWLKSQGANDDEIVVIRNVQAHNDQTAHQYAINTYFRQTKKAHVNFWDTLEPVWKRRFVMHSGEDMYAYTFVGATVRLPKDDGGSVYHPKTKIKRVKR